ncbi:hypothetical protein CR205_07785 [Alteribacter lacisalsi]|uniref:Uncharacterized protein n=1 Tax=Alteribacter lacisalsi TaxID=2045244 RepID=A0A2W0HEP9_9BACI|nr:DUF1657 domain-containing protein [Alteribacter lacisalsi]PYZ98480.1 hypothetical protein CR205_07785 [Alteribacter lacisalsi]
MKDTDHVRGCLATLHRLEAGLADLQMQTTDEEAHDVYRQACLKVRTVAGRLEGRLHELETEPPPLTN